MADIIRVYTEQYTSPRFFEVVKAIKESAGFESYEIIPVLPNEYVSLDQRVVVFGKVENPEYTHPNNVYTYSPAQVVTKANAVSVVSAAFESATGTARVVYPEPKNYRIIYPDVPNLLVEAQKVLFELADSPLLAVDIETSGNLRLVGPDDPSIKLLTVSFYDPKTETAYVLPGGYFEDVGIVEGLLRWFFSAYQGKLLWHNGKFDTRVLSRILGVPVRVDEDTILMHHVLNQAAGQHGLKLLCDLYFGAGDWDAGVKKYTKNGGHYENVPITELAKYNALDTYWTYVLYDFLMKQFEIDEDVYRAYQLELAASEFLLRVEQRGIPFNKENAEALSTTCETMMSTELSWLVQLTGNPNFNPNSPKQVREWLASQGSSVAKTDSETLTELAANTSHRLVKDFCESLLIYRKYAKINSTYAKAWLNREHNGRVHPTFKVFGTSTGRLASSDPNAQNMPRDSQVRAIVGV